MQAGRLDRKVTIQVNTPTKDDFGGEADSWGTLAIVWAEITQVSGRETFEADQIAAVAQVRFRIRYRSDVTAKNRISYNGNLYNIHHAAELGRGDGLDLFTSVLNP